MSEESTPAKKPAVKVTPDFKAGEKVRHKSTGKVLEILGVQPGGLRCRGMAGLIVPLAVEKL